MCDVTAWRDAHRPFLALITGAFPISTCPWHKHWIHTDTYTNSLSLIHTMTHSDTQTQTHRHTLFFPHISAAHFSTSHVASRSRILTTLCCFSARPAVISQILLSSTLPPINGLRAQQTSVSPVSHSTQNLRFRPFSIQPPAIESQRRTIFQSIAQVSSFTAKHQTTLCKRDISRSNKLLSN